MTFLRPLIFRHPKPTRSSLKFTLSKEAPQPVDPPLLLSPTYPETPVHPEHRLPTPMTRHIRHHGLSPKLPDKAPNLLATVLAVRNNILNPMSKLPLSLPQS